MKGESPKHHQNNSSCPNSTCSNYFHLISIKLENTQTLLSANTQKINVLYCVQTSFAVHILTAESFSFFVSSKSGGKKITAFWLKLYFVNAHPLKNKTKLIKMLE